MISFISSRNSITLGTKSPERRETVAIKAELPGRYGHTAEQLAFIREMGIHYLNLNVMPDQANYDDMMRETERLAKYEITISDFACPPLQKNKDIILGTDDRDREIGKFNDFIRLAAAIGAPIVSVAWQPNGILRSGRTAGTHTRGGTAFVADLDEILSRPILNDREYSSEEIWENFRYFLQETLPVAEEYGVCMALHPNDPPVACLGGVASLIASTQDYQRALQMAKGSHSLGVKMCVGCWLENPAFGDLLEDIERFASSGHLVEVHFRNVSSPLPVFEEVLSEDGYADMYRIMKQFIRCGFDGYISVDHGFAGYPSMGGELASMAYATGHMKGLLHAAQQELLSEHRK